MILCTCDFDFDPMIFIYELDLDILKMYLHIVWFVLTKTKQK